MMKNARATILAAAVSAAAIVSFAVPALAQRDPAYAAARANGTVGERVDGYLGIVGDATPALQSMVNDINIKRRAVYSRKAVEKDATVEQYAMTAGCQAIARTVPGEKYQAPSGEWRTRTEEPPERDPRCP